MIAYTELRPVSPGVERLLANIANVVAQCAGNAQFTESDFYIRKPEKTGPSNPSEEFDEFLRARTRKPT